MGWRKIRLSDIVRGTVVRMSSMRDTPYNGATIIGISETGYVRLARPIAYAMSHHDSRCPYLYAEIFEVSTDRMVADGSDFEVSENRAGIPLSHAT